MKTDNKGFTLIELMIVVAIITILSTMTLPSFQDRIIRTQIAQGSRIAEFIKQDIEDFYRKQGKFPKNNLIAGLPLPEKIIGNYVTGVIVQNGMISVKFGNKVNANVAGKTLSIRPAIVPGEPKVPVAWIFGYESIPEGMAAIGENTTNIPARLLPVQWRL